MQDREGQRLGHYQRRRWLHRGAVVFARVQPVGASVAGGGAVWRSPARPGPGNASRSWVESTFPMLRSANRILSRGGRYRLGVARIGGADWRTPLWDRGAGWLGLRTQSV